LKSDSIMPAPSTTDDSGSSASCTGRPVSSRSGLSRFFKSDPPPARMIPRSKMSADSLRRNAFERVVPRPDDGAHWLLQRFADFLVVHRHGRRPAFDEFAERVLPRASDLWVQTSPSQKQRLLAQ
jgi:hypothetical protein